MTDRQTDRQTEISSPYRGCITCSAVKTAGSYFHTSGQNTGIWRTDGQTESLWLLQWSATALQCGRAVKKNKQRISDAPKHWDPQSQLESPLTVSTLTTVPTRKSACRHIAQRHVIPETRVVSSAVLPHAVPRLLALAAHDATASSPPPSCHVTRKPEVDRTQPRKYFAIRRENPAWTNGVPEEERKTKYSEPEVEKLREYFWSISNRTDPLSSYASNNAVCRNQWPTLSLQR